MSNFSISNTVKDFPKNNPYAEIKDKILGKKYNLSLSFIGKTRAAKLNNQYRKKDYIPNVLSFPLTENTGEIYICPMVAKNEAKKFSLSYKGHVAFLYIHGCLHLKGYDHGDTMDKLERKYIKEFLIS